MELPAIPPGGKAAKSLDIRKRAKGTRSRDASYMLSDALQICLLPWFLSLSGYGCCAFGGAGAAGGTLSHGPERRGNYAAKTKD
jgi:hypothetical protein